MALTIRTSPGTSVGEEKAEVSTIKGAERGVLCVIGVSEKGKIGSPIEINSIPDAKKKLGDYVAGYYGRKAVEVAMKKNGARKAYFVRVAHMTTPPTSDAVQASYTAQGYDPETEDQAKVNTLKFRALSEGGWGNRLKITTQKASGGPLLAAFATGHEKLEVTDSSDFEVGDIVEVADTVVHYCRVIVTSIDSVNHYLYCKAQTLGTSIVTASSTVKTCSTHKVRTALDTGTSIATGATYADLVNASGINVGTVLTIVDTRTGGGQPNNVTVQVTRISEKRVFFDAVGAITTIDAANSEVVSQEFDVSVYLDTEQVGTTQKYLSMVDANTKDFVENKFSSEYVEVIDQDSTEGDLGDIPESLSLQALSSGADGLASLADADFTGSEADKTGVYQFNNLAEQFAQFICPDASSATVQNAMASYCEERKWWYEPFIPLGYTSAQARTFVKSTAAFNTNTGRICWPNAKWLNPETGVEETIPICAFTAGANARVWRDLTKGPWVQVAGVEDGILVGATGLEGVDNNGVHETDDLAVRDALYEDKINAIYNFPGYGLVIYGIRTLETDGDFPQMGERVTFYYCEHSVRDGTPWVVFKNIDSRLKGRVKRSIRTFLKGVWLKGEGGLKGATEEEAFDIDVESLNTEEEGQLGNFWGKIGLATKKGAEFVYFLFSKKATS